jgi:hypothetical protein
MDRPPDVVTSPTHLLSDWALAVDVDQVLRGQGADAAVVRQRRPRLVTIAERAIALGADLIVPRAALRLIDVQALRHERLWLEGGGRLSLGPLLTSVAPARQVALVVVTLGPRLEQVVAEILRQEAPLGLALDGFGNAALEALTAAVCAHLEAQAAAAGEYSSIPLSPGLVGWPVEVGQPEIFSQLDTAGIEVLLNDSAQMQPHKSGSMIVGLGPHPFTAGRLCDFCALRDTCRYQDRAAQHGGVTP